MRRAIALSTLLLAFGCGDQPPEMPVMEAVAPKDISGSLALTADEAHGQQLYDALCWTCHGRSGHGDGPATAVDSGLAPPSFHTGLYAELEPVEIWERVKAALYGEDPEHPHMQEVVPALDNSRFMDALKFVPKLAYPAEVPGSALSGRALFAERCAPCHGDDARGTGDMSPLLQISAPDLTADPYVARRDFEAVFDLIKSGGNESIHGSSMPSWGSLYDDTVIWDLVAYVATLQPGVLAEVGLD